MPIFISFSARGSSIRRLVARCALAACALPIVGALANPAPGARPDAGGAEAPVANNASSLSRNDALARFEQGCFPPCQCIVHHVSALRGVMALVPASAPPSSAPPGPRLYFSVRDVNWLITYAGQDTRVTGSGTFDITNPLSLSPLPHTQRMILSLSIGGQPNQVFDSGLVPVTRQFPAIDATVSMNNMVCNDTVFRVSALVVPPGQVRAYSAQGTNYLEGCFNGCACPVSTRPVVGVFGLVALTLNASAPPGPTPGGNTGDQEWAVVNVRWAFANAAAPTPVPPNLNQITGSGIYKRARSAGPLPVIAHRMWLDLTLPPGGPSPSPNIGPVRFDSGLVPDPGAFPTIDIDIADNGFWCYNRVFQVLGRPIPSNAAPGVSD